MTEYEPIMQKALCIEDDLSNYDTSMPPANGHQYLYCVMQEAAKCPDILVATLDQAKLKKDTRGCFDEEVLPRCSPDLVPLIDWQLEQVADFSELRRTVDRRRFVQNRRSHGSNPPVRLPRGVDEKSWLEFCVGSSDKEQMLPTMKVLLEFNQPKLEKLLDYFVKWLQNGVVDFEEPTTLWLYSILAAIEIPLMPSVCSSLRDLARASWIRRAKIETKDDKMLVRINLIICIVGRYFRQHDLSD